MDVHRAARLERDAETRVAEAHQQRDAVGLGERFAARDAHVARTVTRDLGQDLIDRAPLAAVEGVLRVTVTAAQRTAGEPDEHGGDADADRLALKTVEDLSDAEPLGGRQLRA